MTVKAVVTGFVQPPPDDGVVKWVAAAPPDRRQSFSGSGLPFGSEDQAFYNTPNAGEMRVGLDGHYRIEMNGAPNSYHDGPTAHPVPPQVHLHWANAGPDHTDTVSIPHATETARSLFPSCFQNRPASQFEDIMTQEQYLRAERYMPPDGKPPHEFVP